MSEVTFHFDNGKDMKLKNNQGGTSFTKSGRPALGPPNRRKKKKKSKRSKKGKEGDCEAPNFAIDNVSLTDPDADYPQSRVIKLNPNGELIVESLDDEYPPEQNEEGQNVIPNVEQLVKLSPRPDLILFRYEDEVTFWNELTEEEKLDILSVSYEEIESRFKEEVKAPHNHYGAHGVTLLHAADCNEDIDCDGCAKDFVYINEEIRKEIEPYFDSLIRNSWFMQDENTVVEYFDPKEGVLPVLLRKKSPVSLLTKISSKPTKLAAQNSILKLPPVSEEDEPKFLVSDWEHKAFCDNMALVQSDHTKTKGSMLVYDSFDRGVCTECFPDQLDHTVNAVNYSLLERTLLRAERMQSVAIFKSRRVFESYKYKKEYFRETSPHERFQWARAKLQEMLPSFPYEMFKENILDIRKALLHLYCIDENINPVHELNTSLWLLRGDLEPHLKNKDILTGEELFEDYIDRSFDNEQFRKAREATGNDQAISDTFRDDMDNYSARYESQLSLMPGRMPENDQEEERTHDMEDDELSEHESCERGCIHEHQSSYSDEELGDEPDSETVAKAERFGELLGLFFIQSTQYVRGRFLDAFNKKSCDYRTQEFIKELQAEEDAKKEKQLRKELQKEKQKEQRLAQQKLKEEEKKKRELKEIEKAKLIEKQKEDQRAEQLRQREMAILKKEEEKMKRIEALKNRHSSDKKAVLANSIPNKDSQQTFQKPRETDSPAKHATNDSEPLAGYNEISPLMKSSAIDKVDVLILESFESSAPNRTVSSQDSEIEESQLTNAYSNILPEHEQTNRDILTEQSIPRNHILDQLYHTRPKSMSLSPEYSPISTNNTQVNGSPALGLNLPEHRLRVKPDIWLPMHTSISSELVITHDKHHMKNSFAPSQDLQYWFQADSLLSNTPAVRPSLNETRSRNIWSTEFTAPSRPRWGLQPFNSQLTPNATIWNPLPAVRPMHNQASLNDGKTQSIHDAAYNAMQNLKVSGVSTSDVAPTLQVFQTAKSILGTPGLGLSEFLKSLSSSSRFELLYDDTGSVSHIKVLSMAAFHDPLTQPPLLGLSLNPSTIQLDPQTQLGLSQLAHPMNAFAQERALSIPSDAPMRFQGELPASQAVRPGVTLHSDGQMRGRFGLLASGASDASGVPREGIW